MTIFDAIWDEIHNPHGGRLAAAHARATTAGAHAVLYWLVKERGDLRRGGAWLDGAEDTLCVWIGTCYIGPWWWPVAVLAIMGYVMAMGAIRAR